MAFFVSVRSEADYSRIFLFSQAHHLYEALAPISPLFSIVGKTADLKAKR